VAASNILLCACDLWIYRELGVTEYRRNCSDNMHEALATLGITVPWTPTSRLGDHVLLRAAFDVVVVLSACPQDITAVNGGEPRDAEIELIV